MFSKYEVYSTIQSMYCYPDTNVLKNKLSLRDAAALKLAEEEITAIKQFHMLYYPIPGRFSKNHLLRIHQFMFSDIYPFAGKLRKEQISKASTIFYPPDLIERELKKVFDFIKIHQYFKALNQNDVLDKLSYVMATLNMIHPFREGNGRATREFIRLLALYNGYNLNWGNINKETLLNALILSVDDYALLVPILKQCLS